MSKKFRASVMISSTTKDLEDHRSKVIEACLRAKMFPDAMESYTALSHPNADAISMSLKMVDECDIYLGIFGKRYGYIPDDANRNPNRFSITEMEYRRALDLRKPMLIFVMGDDHNVPSTLVDDETEEQRAKRKDFHKLVKGRIVGFFNSALDLHSKALQALFEYIINNSSSTDLDDSQQIIIPIGERSSLPPLPELYSIPRYNLTKRFIGRAKELDQLDQWAGSSSPVMVVEAIGGMGKSALTWEWTNQRADELLNPAGVMWWSFYEGGATVEGFIRHALAYVTQQEPETLKELSYEERATQLINELNRKNYLLVMDGFERVLVAYHRIDRAHLRDEQVEEGQDYRNCTDPRDAEFIRRLTSLRNSKILMSTRLMPAAFEEFNLPVSGVDHIGLNGLNEDDAYALFFDMGVKRASSALLTEFFRHIGYHSLLIKIVAINVAKDHRPALGDFDHWYHHHGMQENLAMMAAHDKRNHILHYAFGDLSESARNLLSQIAAFSDPIDFETLSVFNPFLPPRPPLPELPPLPQIRPSPFGSPRLAWLLARYYREKDKDGREKIQHLINEQESEDQKIAAYIQQNQVRLNREYQQVKQQRRHLIDEYHRKYRTSPEYLRGIEEFDLVLTELEERGLLSWDRENDIYDLHPVVRGYALSLLPEEARKQAFTRIIDHYGTVQSDDNAIKEVTDLRAQVELYRALVNTGELDIAATYYHSNLSSSLSRLGGNHLIIELMRPLFLDGIDRYPPLENRLHASYTVTHLARALHRVGDIQAAQMLYSLNLDPDADANAWGMAINVIDYAFIMLEYNAIARSIRAFKLAEELTPADNLAWAYYDNFTLTIIMGDWNGAQKQYELALDVPPPVTQPNDWRARLAQQRAVMMVRRGDTAAEDALKEAKQLLYDTFQKSNLGRLLEVEAEFWLNRGEYIKAEHAISQSIEIAQQSGESVGVRQAILARIYLAQDRQNAANRLVTMALRDRQITDGSKGDLYAQLAWFYLRAGDSQQAQRYAEQAYDFAWADGEPYIRWHPLSLSKRVFNELGLAHPVLSLWDDSLAEPIPYEDELREKYLKDGELIQKSSGAKQQEPFIVTHSDWFQVGTLATFGIDNDDLVESLGHKIASLSDMPTTVVTSRMGDEVPFPDEIEVIDEKHQLEELNFTLEERKFAEKCFLICYLESKDENGDKIYAYFNVRFDRLKNLFDKLAGGEPFDLASNVTMIVSGKGDLSNDDREKLRRDYLFGEYSTHVRIFPPLEEVNNSNKPSPLGSPQPRSGPYVEMTRFTSFQIGTLAVFGLEDDEFINGLAYKMTRLSDQPTKPLLSKMGEEVPPCSQDGKLNLEPLPFHQLMFSADERRNLDKVFSIVRVFSHNTDGEPVYAYVNVRGDRIESLLSKGSQDASFNIAQYSTLVQHGEGLPPSETEQKLYNDYLFRDECLVVRIFPPLSEVT